MRLIVLDAAQTQAHAALTDGGRIVAERRSEIPQGIGERLPLMLQELFGAASVAADDFDAIAVTVGPGSFTGIRAALALAEGLAMGSAKPVLPVTVGEAMRQALPHLGLRTLWTVTPSRRGHIYLEDSSGCAVLPLESLPKPADAVAVAGEAAVEVAARLAARDVNVMLTDARIPGALAIAAASHARAAGQLPPLAATPLYVEPPAVKPPSGLRPPPGPSL